MFDFDKDKSIISRSGPAQGASNERKLIGSTLDGGSGIETRMRVNADGSTTILKTRMGSPEITTTEVASKTDHEQAMHGGFIFSPHDGIEDVAGTNRQYAWDECYGKTVNYYHGSLLKKVKLPAPVFDVKLKTKRKAKHVSWCGTIIGEQGLSKECVVSWDHGLDTRYRLHHDQDCSGRLVKMEGGFPEFANAGRPGVCVNGKEIDTSITVTVNDVPKVVSLNVVGAAVFNNRLVIASHVDLSVAGEENRITKALADSCTLAIFYRDGNEWKEAGRHKFGSALKAPWFFSPAGNRAIAIREPSQTNQSLMTAELLLDDQGKVAFSVTDTPLDAKQFVAETTGSPKETFTQRGPYWDTPGPWTKWTNAQYLTGSGWHFIDWTQNELDSVASYDAAAAAYVANGGNPLIREDYRVDTIAVNFPIKDADWSQSDYEMYELYMGLSAYGTIRAQSGAHAYRNITYVMSDGLSTYQYPRSVSGLRYICADFDFDGNVMKLSERFYGPSCGFVFTAEEKLSTEKRRLSIDATEYYSVSKLTRRYELNGETAWQYELNGKVLFSAKGGPKSNVQATHVREIRTKLVDAGGTTTGDPPTMTRTYSPAGGTVGTERIWLIDADLRSSSFIYELLHVDYHLTPLGGDEGSIEDYFESRIPYWSESKASIHLWHNGQQLVDPTEFTLLGNPESFLRPYAVMLTTIPRAHDLAERVEEDSQIPRDITWMQGATPLTAGRVWAFSLEMPYDPMPRSANTAPKGQIQTRDKRHTVFSTSSITTSRLQPSPLGGDYTELHPVTYHTVGYFNGDYFDVLAKVQQTINQASAKTQIKAVGDGFRLFPVKAT